jgi:uncharacterized protein involved in exopolysaccharide biosynthesis
MNDKAIEQLRQQLLSLSSALQEREETYKETEATVELDQTRVGRLSRMDAMQIQQMALDSHRVRRVRLLFCLWRRDSCTTACRRPDKYTLHGLR